MTESQKQNAIAVLSLILWAVAVIHGLNWLWLMSPWYAILALLVLLAIAWRRPFPF